MKTKKPPTREPMANLLRVIPSCGATLLGKSYSTMKSAKEHDLVEELAGRLSGEKLLENKHPEDCVPLANVCISFLREKGKLSE